MLFVVAVALMCPMDSKDLTIRHSGHSATHTHFHTYIQYITKMFDLIRQAMSHTQDTQITSETHAHTNCYCDEVWSESKF